MAKTGFLNACLNFSKEAPLRASNVFLMTADDASMSCFTAVDTNRNHASGSLEPTSGRSFTLSGGSSGIRASDVGSAYNTFIKLIARK